MMAPEEERKKERKKEASESFFFPLFFFFLGGKRKRNEGEGDKSFLCLLQKISFFLPPLLNFFFDQNVLTKREFFVCNVYFFFNE